jgi:D-hydroxyproline dehydrogenase subunit gamma
VVTITVDNRSLHAPAGISLAAALLNAEVARFRSSVRGEPRGPLCGMGSCYECRVTVDGVGQQRACLLTVREGMRVVTGG